MKGLLSKEQKAFFADHYALLGPKVFTEQYNKEFGTNYSGHWAKKTAYRLGYSTYSSIPSGFYSIAQVAYLLGCSRQNVNARIRTGSIKVASECKGTKILFIHEDEMDRLLLEKEKQKEPMPWPAMKMPQACRKLGIEDFSLLGVIKRGNIDAVMRGGCWYVRKEHVMWGYDQMVKHGFVSIPWYKMRERLQK